MKTESKLKIYLLCVLAFFVVMGVGLSLFKSVSGLPDFLYSNPSPSFSTEDSSPKQGSNTDSIINDEENNKALIKKEEGSILIKSVRVDLSSMDIPEDFDQFGGEIIGRLKKAGANTVFISPWSDGYANYKSRVAPQNDFGKRAFLESFITKSHEEGLKVYAWFVVGKDNFPDKIHPEWFSETIEGKKYYDEDEPGINLAMASLANKDYIAYHLKTIEEVGRLGVDGWVISEPLMSWGDRYDADYADFSKEITEKFMAETSIDPKLIFDESSSYFYEKNTDPYQRWVDFRARVVTNFVAGSIGQMSKLSDGPIIITVFTEPDKNGQLVSLSYLKEWLGMDIEALVRLSINNIEIQNLFLDFEFPQKPEWVRDMISQFRLQLRYNIPLMVSVQGFASAGLPLAPQDFSKAIFVAAQENIAGVSFYAYHTLRDEHWTILKRAWE